MPTVFPILVSLVVLSLLLYAPADATASTVVTGRIDTDHADVLGSDGRPARALEYKVLDTGGQRLTLEGAAARDLPNGAKVKLRGQRSGGQFLLAAADGVVSVEPAAQTSPPDATVETKRVAVLLANFPNDTRQPWTADQASAALFGVGSAAEYWNEVSNSRLALTGDVFGYFTLGVSTAKCDYSGWMAAAKAAATATGIVLPEYTNVMLVFPRQSVCSWSGLANVIGRNSFINGSLTTYVTSHELGHNFGIYHAASLRCRDAAGVRVAYSSDCTLSEYGDPFDVMGEGTRHTSNWHRRQLGFITRADQRTVTSSGTYEIATAEVHGGTPRILRVARPTGDFFYLEWRQPYGRFDAFATTSAAVRGVMIRIAPDTTRGRSKLLDMTPSTTSWHDAPLPKGSTFTDPTSGISITTVGFDARSATVEIAFRPIPTPAPTAPPAATPSATRTPSPTPTRSPSATVSRSPSPTPTRSPSPTPTRLPTPTPVPDRQAPTAPQNLTGVAHQNKVRLSWARSTDNAGTVTYQVFADGALARTTSATSDFVPVKRGKHYFVVRAVDAAGNVSIFSNRVDVFVQDWRGQ